MQNSQNHAWVWTDVNKIEKAVGEVPTPARDEVLVQVKAVGICGTDLGILGGYNPNARAPLPLGHEIAGLVVAAGAEVGQLAPGDRIFLDPYIGCNQCEACRQGRKTYCSGGGKHLGIHIPGGWQQYLAIPERNCYRIPDNLSFAEASQAETMYTVVSAISRLNSKAGTTAMVIGDGPTGLLFTRLLVLAGVVGVTVVGHHESRLALAQTWGAKLTINTRNTPLEDALGGELFDIVVDSVGSQLSMNQCVAHAAPSGQVVLFGLPAGNKPLEVDITGTVFKELSLLGATDNPSVWPQVVNILESGLVDLKAFITESFPFNQLPQAVEAGKRKDMVKVVVENPGES